MRIFRHLISWALALFLIAFFVGGLSNPLYSLLIAHTNDFLDNDQMASASGGLIFLNGVGASIGPIATGYVMTIFGESAFWGFQGACLSVIALYGVYRMTQRAAPVMASMAAASVTRGASCMMSMPRKCW